MAEQILKTRIKLRYDTLANWTSVNPTLALGEVGVVAIPTESTTTVGQVTKPAILFKVGDGETAWADLPYASGLAADVYSWAKAASKPSYKWSEINEKPSSFTPASHNHDDLYYQKSEVDGLFENYYDSDEVDAKIAEIQGALEADTNTKYQLVQSGTILKLQSKEIGGSWADVESFDLATILANTFDAKGAASQALADAKSYADAEIDKVEAKIPTVPVQSVNSKTGAVVLNAGDVGAYTKAEVDGLIPEVPVDSVNGKTGAVVLSAGDVSAYSKTEVDELIEGVEAQIPSVPVQSVNSKTGAVVLAAGDVGAYTKAEVDAKVKANADAIEALTNGTSTEEIDSVMELVNYVNEHGTEVQGMKQDIDENKQAIGELETLTQGHDSDISGILEKPAMGITSANITDWNDAVSKEHSHSNKTVLDGITSTKVSNWDNEVGAKAAAATAQAKADSAYTLAEGKEAAGTAQSLINGLDGAITGTAGAGKTLTAFKQENGKVTATFGNISITKSQVSDFGSYDAAGSAAQALADAKTYTDQEVGSVQSDVDGLGTRVSTLEAKPGLDKVGTVTSVSAGVGLKVTGTASVTPKVEIDNTVIFVLDGGAAAGY